MLFYSKVRFPINDTEKMLRFPIKFTFKKVRFPIVRRAIVLFYVNSRDLVHVSYARNGLHRII